MEDQVLYTLKVEQARLEKRLRAIKAAVEGLTGDTLPAGSPAPKKRILSAASRAKLAAAGRKRWANAKKS